MNEFDSLEIVALWLEQARIKTAYETIKKARSGGRFNQSSHPRYPAENSKGGQFRPKAGGGGGNISGAAGSLGSAVGSLVGARLGAAAGAALTTPIGMGPVGVVVGAIIGERVGDTVGKVTGKAIGQAITKLSPVLEKIAPDLDVSSWVEGFFKSANVTDISEKTLDFAHDMLWKMDEKSGVLFSEKYAYKAMMAKGDYQGLKQYHDFLKDKNPDIAGQIALEMNGRHGFEKAFDPEKEARDFLNIAWAYAQLHARQENLLPSSPVVS